MLSKINYERCEANIAYAAYPVEARHSDYVSERALPCPETASFMMQDAEAENRQKAIISSFSIAERILYLFSKPPRIAFRPPGYAQMSGEWDAARALSTLQNAFPELDRLIRGKRILDYGCGEGFQAVAMRKYGASEVHGVDIHEGQLRHAREVAKGVEGITFSTELPPPGSVDVVISQNSFEHFPQPEKNLAEMAAALRAGGEILICFGPPWLAPYGSHMHFFTTLPWVNVVFSERTVHRVRSLYRVDGAMTYGPNLNKMTLRRFERLIKASGLEVVFRRYRPVQNLPLVTRVPYLREFLTNEVSCILRKPT